MPVHRMNSQDDAHLKLISVLHFVMGGLYLLGIGFIILHFMIMSFVLRAAEGDYTAKHSSPAVVLPASPDETAVVMESPLATPAVPVPARPPASPFPKEIMPLFIAFYAVGGVILVVLCVCNVLSGLYIRERKNRTFSFIVAGVNCIQFPFGTALGVFTFIVLSRVGVKMDYDHRLPA